MVRMMVLVLCLAAINSSAAEAAPDAAVAYTAELKSSNVPNWPHSWEYAWGHAALIREIGTGTIFLTVNFFGLAEPPARTSLLRLRANGQQDTLMEFDPAPTGSAMLAATIDHDQQIADALAQGELGIHVSDQRYTDGAIRGTFEYVTVDVEATAWSQVKNLFKY